ncbi:sensor histidine kinase [Aquimarina rubra]|uniref:Sensor histidine kinase n=1 Tax=Aquimarina rubra TaxID=1920033 RepID=A0ABW5LLP6_9FLAO
MKLSLNKYYIFFAFVGWSLIFFLTLAGPKLFLNTKELTDERLILILAESMLCGLFAYLCSFIISLYIDYKVDLNKRFLKLLWPIILVFISTQIFYNFIIWPILGYASLLIKGEYVVANTVGKIYNVVYFATLFIIWLFIFLTIKIYHQLKKVQLKQLQLESSLRESQLNTLKGQINPHFMFNSLNNIRGLMLEDVGRARQMLTNLSETLRYSLTKSDVDSIALEDELEMVENYVEVSKIQFEKRLQFETDIDQESLNKQIPPMIIQMLVENAIKHGISNLKEGGKVSLSTMIEDNQLHIEVANSGTLQKSENSTQLGLQNIKKRLELLFGNDATFNLKEIENKVVATIKIPLT